MEDEPVGRDEMGWDGTIRIAPLFLFPWRSEREDRDVGIGRWDDGREGGREWEA